MENTIRHTEQILRPDEDCFVSSDAEHVKAIDVNLKAKLVLSLGLREGHIAVDIVLVFFFLVILVVIFRWNNLLVVDCGEDVEVHELGQV
jgi:hypothetical protein